jgi:hypothetical protein
MTCGRAGPRSNLSEVDDRFAPVDTVFEESLASGASVCVNVDGQTVVDL